MCWLYHFTCISLLGWVLCQNMCLGMWGRGGKSGKNWSIFPPISLIVLVLVLVIPICCIELGVSNDRKWNIFCICDSDSCLQAIHIRADPHQLTWGPYYYFGSVHACSVHTIITMFTVQCSVHISMFSTSMFTVQKFTSIFRTYL